MRQLAAGLHARGARWNIQSDWTYLQAVSAHDNATVTAATNGKNLLRWAVEDLGMEADPHAHESQYNYADIAYLHQQVGLTPSKVVGGFLYSPLDNPQGWMQHQAGIFGVKYPSYFWKADILWGAATPNHRGDDEDSFGAWRPKSESDFTTHDPNQRLLYVARGCRTLAGTGEYPAVDAFLAAAERGQLSPDRFYAAALMINQGSLTVGQVADVLALVDRLRTHVATGRVKFVGLTEAAGIWLGQYGGRPNRTTCEQMNEAAGIVERPITPRAQATPAMVSKAEPDTYARTAAATPTDQYAIFSVNVQDFSYPERSIATVKRILDIHERARIPVDFYLTTTMTDLFEQMDPALLQRLKTSAVASVSYHVRPPKPYYTNYDWAGLASKTAAEQYAAILNYETHGLDLTTGLPTAANGGYKKLTEVIGYAPWAGSAQSDDAVGAQAALVFKNLGGRFRVRHGRAANLGDKLDGVYLRPEHYDLLLFQTVGQDAGVVVENAIAASRTAAGGTSPYFVGIKMHDNDFFAEDSAWVTVYVNGPRRPPFATNRRSALLSEAAQAAIWAHYEATVAYVVAQQARVTAVGLPQVWAMLHPTAAGTSAASSMVYISGTMHIESNRLRWPNVDRLLAFLTRATQAGRVGNQTNAMRWSVGADIGWLQGEPRAAEVITRLEAMGVEMDIHAHGFADRASCAARITQLGGHPNRVSSGNLTSEVDRLRLPVTDASGASWQAEVLYGIVTQSGHGPGVDDEAYGLWRPKSGADWKTHDPQASLIAMGGGPRTLTGAAALIERLKTASGAAPVYSSTIMVHPDSLVVVDTNDGIDQIEAWAATSGLNSNVRWATVSETAAAWLAAGGVPSRVEDLTTLGSTTGTSSPCTVVLDAAEASVAASGDIRTVSVTAASGCAWTAVANAGWITVTGTPPGTGNGTVRYQVAANTGAARSATVMVGGVAHIVMQAPANCTYSVTGPAALLANTAGSYTVNVSTQPGCAWQAVSESTWLTLGTSRSGSGPGSFPFTASANSSTTPRPGTLSVAGQSLRYLQSGSGMSQFTDVAASHPFLEYINFLKVQAITTGCSGSATMYCPEDAMTRAEMAAFLVRALLGENFTSGSTPYFADVPAGHAAFRYIQKLKELGVTNGCTAATYCPDATVTRGQMAAFVVRAVLGVTATDLFPYTPSPYFTDIPSAHPFFAYIQKLRELGITTGCTATTYCGEDGNTRGQMAVFVTRAFF
ncbi:MAG: S-layer homology domain-containing protein [Bryobacterales bacterium]|nr:S-layer homology domain-containing protein [Bryobacterales bacterium]